MTAAIIKITLFGEEDRAEMAKKATIAQTVLHVTLTVTQFPTSFKKLVNDLPHWDPTEFTDTGTLAHLNSQTIQIKPDSDDVHNRCLNRSDFV